MSKTELPTDDDWTRTQVRRLDLDDDGPAWGRLSGWIGRAEFTDGGPMRNRRLTLARIAAAAVALLIITAFGVFNLQQLGVRHANPAATPSAAPSAPTPPPTSRVITPGIPNPPPAGSWQTIAGLPAAEANFAGAVLADGRVLIAGGVSDTTVAGSATADVELYDPTAKRFTPAASMSTGRAGHTATLLRDGRVLVVGGYTQLSSRALRSVEIYDPTSDSWTAAAPLNHGHSGQAAVLLADGRVMVVGGASFPALGISPHGAVPATLAPEIYDPGRDTWTVVRSQTLDRPVLPTATLLKNGKVLVVGGQYMWNSADEDVERSEVYDVASDSWAAVRADPRFQARQFHTATLLSDGHVLIAGGAIDLQPTATAALYDPATNSWIELPHMTQPRCGQGAVAVATGRVLVAGSGCWTTFAMSAEEFDPASNRWYAVAGTATPRGSGMAASLRDGTVLLVGGMTSNGATNEAEIFHS